MGNPRLRLKDALFYQREFVRDVRLLWKQSEQYTGLSPRGTNGTCAGLPHDEHVVVCISR
ncbi:MAG: hypothetical protein NVS2B7_32110 [Herpetosiphon sp.]